MENLAEKIESLDRSERSELRSQITRVVRHLLKLGMSAATHPRAGLRRAIDEARGEIEGLLEHSPSLRREVDVVIKRQIRAAAKLAADDLSQYGEPAEATQARLEQRGFTAEQVLGDWFPDAPG